MRFYLPPHAWDAAQLNEAETHHAQRVLRLQPGATITVFDGDGREASATIEAFHKKNASLRLGALQQTPRPPVEITLAQAIPKGRNMDLIIQKAVELGVTRIIPLVTDRTIVRCQDDETKQERWQAIALEACKQCGQNWMPTVEAPCSLQESLDFFQNSTSDANCDVAPVLASSSINYTLSRCAPEAPGTWPRSLPDCSPSGLSDERHLASSQEARLSPEASLERNLVLPLAPKIFFSPRSVLWLSLFLILFVFPFPSILKALCWSLVGLMLLPMIGRRWGYEVAALAADQVLFFGALLSLLVRC
ncbi:MAG: RsmE family RNA methyltransferase [Verrucomicrobiota bacterium]